MGIRAPSAAQSVERVFQCPECIHEAATPEELGAHLVRHQELSPAGDGLLPCAKGCGRHFPKGYGTGGRDKHNHEAICDGSPPLIVEPEEPTPKAIEPKEATMAKLECKWCSKPYKHAKRLENHEGECHKIGLLGETKPSPRTSKSKPSPAAARKTEEGPVIDAEYQTPAGELSATRQTLVFLRQVETHYQGKLNEVHGLIDAVKSTEGKA